MSVATMLGGESWYLGLEGPGGECTGGLAIQVAGSRALPGFKVLRVERLGGNLREEAQPAAFEALVHLAREDRRVLQLHVECFSAQPRQLVRLSEVASRAGMTRSPVPRCYDKTLIIRLKRQPDELLAGFHATARQNIRSIRKFPLEVRPIDDTVWIPRLNQLLDETFSRTGGAAEAHDWNGIIRHATACPGNSRLVGLFRTDQAGPGALLACALGLMHGDHAQYATAASTRKSELRVSMAYPLAWDLILWANGLGAEYFDFGGVSAGSHGGSDPLGGISDFKRYFRGDLATVGEEWTYQPHPGAARIAAAIRWTAALAASFWRPRGLASDSAHRTGPSDSQSGDALR